MVAVASRLGEQSVGPDTSYDLPDLYEETFPAVAAFVSKMGGTLDDARDIFHDALILFLEKEAELTLQLSPAAYIVGIAKNLWVRKYKHDASLVVLDDVERSLEVPHQETSPIATRLLRLLEVSGRACLELLTSFYYHRMSPEKIAQQFHFSGARSATVQKYKCLEKVRNTVKEKSLGYEDFVE